MTSSFFTPHKTLQVKNEVILRMAWSSDGRYIAAPTELGKIVLWDTINPDELQNHSIAMPAHRNEISCVAFSPDGQHLTSGGKDGNLILWRVLNGNLELTHVFENAHTRRIYALSWSPDGSKVASCSDDQRVIVWDITNKQASLILREHTYSVEAVAWSPDGDLIATGDENPRGGEIRIWHARTGACLQILRGHTNWVLQLAWAPNSQFLASASDDYTIRLWSRRTGWAVRVMHGHTNSVKSVCFSADGTMLASRSRDDSLRLWSVETATELAKLSEYTTITKNNVLFHPSLPMLAGLVQQDTGIQLWYIDRAALRVSRSQNMSTRQSNAKVVFVGESGAGKTCLIRALMGENPLLEASSSTHGMKIYLLNREILDQTDGIPLSREVIAWDLAGQPDYRIVHYLFLDQSSLGVIVYDPTHPDEPFRGVEYWLRALRSSRRA